MRTIFSTLALAGSLTIAASAFGSPAVPELASWSLTLLGLGGLGANLRAARRRPVAVAARTNRF